MKPIGTNQNMDVEKVFHMTGGTGDNSYAKNSSYQVYNPLHLPLVNVLAL
jgi:hypothetical protein